MTAQTYQRPGWISVDEACRLIGVGDEWLRQLAKKGVIPLAQKGMYPLEGLVQGYIGYLKGEAQDGSRAEAARRIGDARTREIELRIAERSHQVIDRDEHISVVDERCGMFISEMNGLPARVTRDLALRSKIRTEVDAMRTRLTARAELRASELKATGTSAAAGGD